MNVDSKINELRDPLKTVIIERSYRENHETPFLLTSGKKSPYYFDLKQTLLDPQYLQMASKAILFKMLAELNESPKAVSGLTMGADPIVYSISLLSMQSGSLIYPLVVRKKPKSHGSNNLVEGLLDKLYEGDEVVLIDDVITTGKSTLQAYDALVSQNLKPRHVFCVLDRMEGGKETLAKAGLTLHSLFDLNDFKAN